MPAKDEEILVKPSGNAAGEQESVLVVTTATPVDATPVEQTKPVATFFLNTERDVPKLPSVYPLGIADLDSDYPEINQLCNQLHEYLCKSEERQLDKVVALMSSANATTRTQVFYQFNHLFSVGLETVVDSLVKSKHTYLHFAYLLLPPHVADAYIVSLFLDTKINPIDSALMMIFLGRTTEELAILTAEYSKQTDKDVISLDDFWYVGFGSSVKHLLKRSIQLPRPVYDTRVHTDGKARSDAEFIHKKGPGRSKLRHPLVNEKMQQEIIDVLVSSPPEHIKNIDAAYIKKYGYTLQKCIEKIFDRGFGELKHITLFSIAMAMDPYEGIATLFYVFKKNKLLDLKNKNNMFLTMLLIRYQDHLGEVEKAYQNKYDTKSTLH